MEVYRYKLSSKERTLETIRIQLGGVSTCLQWGIPVVTPADRTQVYHVQPQPRITEFITILF